MKHLPILSILALGLMAGCTPPALGNLQNIGRESDPTRFYTLNATAQGLPEGTAAMPWLVLGIGPVSVADYLDRSQIVVRESENRLTLAEFDRWAGKPANELQRVLAANLAAQLGTERVVRHPWKSSIAPDRTVEVEVERFEHEAGKVWLVASWQVFADNGREAVAFRRSTFSRESSGDYDAISAALSGLAEELSAEIAAAIRAAERNRPPR